MTWLQFFIWLTSLYCFYYLANIIIDWTKQQSETKATQVQELTFIEHQIPEQISPHEEIIEEAPIPEPVSKGLGGVSMKSIFQLARTEAINLTTSVSF